jgi:hypothetical protein
MKKLVNEILFGKNSLVNGLIALSIIGLIGLGCFCNKDKMGLGKNDSSTPSSTATATPSPSATKEYKKADASKNEIPSDDELQDMVKKTLLDFNKALQDEDFTDFHKTIAKRWQDQITPEKFKSSFQGFIDKNVDIGNIKSETASFDEDAKIDRSRGLKELTVKGKYDTSPLPCKFELKYVPEGKEWKLYGIEVDTRRDY